MMVPRLKPSIQLFVFSADHVGSGSVTLKNASVALFSYGPGVSMDAELRARAKGGVSCTVGAHAGRYGDDLFLLDEADQAAESIAEALQQSIGLGMVLLQHAQHLLGRLVGIDLRGDALQLSLVLVQVVVANLQQTVERDLDHVVVEQLLAVELGPSGSHRWSGQSSVLQKSW